MHCGLLNAALTILWFYKRRHHSKRRDAVENYEGMRGGPIE